MYSCQHLIEPLVDLKNIEKFINISYLLEINQIKFQADRQMVSRHADPSFIYCKGGVLLYASYINYIALLYWTTIKG